MNRIYRIEVFFRHKLVLEVLKGDLTINEIPSKYMDINWLKKVRIISLKTRKDWINCKSGKDIPPIKRQCNRLGISRSCIYYKNRPRIFEKEDGRFKRLIEEMFAKNPTYGTRRMTKYLNKLKIKIG